MQDRIRIEDEDYDVFVDDDESWDDEYIPPYYEELDFDKDPETTYIHDEEDGYDEDV